MPLRVGMIFGGRSVEHEVSVLTAHQAMAALPADDFTAVPIYIAKSGQWYTGEVLRTLDNFRDLDQLVSQAEPVTFNPNTPRAGLLIARTERRGLFGGGGTQLALEPLDVVFPLVHGSHGEDGTLQGLFELADIPYVGSNVSASAIGIDKGLTKTMVRAAGLPVLDDLAVTRARWDHESAAVVAEAEARFGFPLFIKPARLGSSIGVARAENATDMRFALDVALTYDSRALVEPAQQPIIEVNCAVLGEGAEARASVCEQPVSAGVLSYEDKYMRGGKSKGMQGARRIIPAPISPELTGRIQQAALQAFAAIGASGVARIDFLVRPEQDWFVVNEINTMPGSLSFYLWEPAGLAFPQLLRILIDLARARQTEKRRSTFTFSSGLLAAHPLAGAKQP